VGRATHTAVAAKSPKSVIRVPAKDPILIVTPQKCSERDKKSRSRVPLEHSISFAAGG
jgi:hypothetical protein